MKSRALYVLCSFVLVAVTLAFVFQPRPFGVQLQHARLPAYRSMVTSNTGRVVVAEVDDIGESFKDPIVTFKVSKPWHPISTASTCFPQYSLLPP
ncbi:hypothetical protein EON65_29765 [archaeon]|nr:MAG: hypothetical protein EON65_29765 [archaeon]